MPSKSPEKHPKRWKWRLEWLVQTSLEKLAGLLPGPLVFQLGEALGEVAWHFMTARRQIVLRNLRIAFAGELEMHELRAMVLQVFRRTGANLFSALHTSGLTADEVAEIISIENEELPVEALTRGPGLLLMPSHMGNWEILTRIHRRLPPGHANGAFYRPLNNLLLDDRVLAQRAAQGCRLFSKRDSFHQATGFLRDGGILGILADQRVGIQGELIQFFGRVTRASPLPALMARRSKCDVLAMSLVTESPGRWRIRYHALRGAISTAACMEAIERSMKCNPLDVFWFQERWKVYVRPSCTIRHWLGPDSRSERKPHRALLWLAGVPADWQRPDEWTHPDVVEEIVLAEGQEAPAWLAGGEIVHRVPVSADRYELRKSISTIDATAALPVDYILTCEAPKSLSEAAQGESIRLVSLTRTTELAQ